MIFAQLKHLLMKQISLALLILFTIVSCGKKEADLTVTGTIKGLKKGTVYLQQLKDTSLVMLDSMVINGEAPFMLQSELKEPEVLYLMLDKNSAEDSRIAFFADKGVTEINTSLKRFGFNTEIKGSDLQVKLEEFNKMISKFNNRSLELIKEQFEANQSGDTSLINAKVNETKSLLRRKYLFAINFAVNNKDSEIAPYVALAEIYDANTKFLDTIYTSLTKDIADSKYGKELGNYIKKRKEEEQQQNN